MQIALDTNAYSTLQIGASSDFTQLVDEAELLVIPYIVDAELRAGFKKGRKPQDNYNKLQKFQAIDRVLVIWPDAATNELYASIWADLAVKGRPIPTNDVWIAALCLQHNLHLATNDAHFRHVPLLQTLPAA